MPKKNILKILKILKISFIELFPVLKNIKCVLLVAQKNYFF